MDARHGKTSLGRVLMARGRDAVDVALTTSFGDTKLEKFLVWTDEVKSDVESQPQTDETPDAGSVSIDPVALGDSPRGAHVYL